MGFSNDILRDHGSAPGCDGPGMVLLPPRPLTPSTVVPGSCTAAGKGIRSGATSEEDPRPSPRTKSGSSPGKTMLYPVRRG
jgi:hypothetical protein